MSLNKIQKTNLILIFFSLATIVSGFMLHIAGHSASHKVWEIWAVLHSIISISFLVLIVMHLKQHSGWIKTFAKKMRIATPQGKMFIVLAILLSIVVISGLVLLGVISCNSHLGLWHYKVGIIFSLLAIIHVARRHKMIKII